MLPYAMLLLSSSEELSDFERMYDEYRLLLYHVAFDILHDSYLAEDAVSTTFFKAAEHFSKISSPICPKTKRFLVIVCERASIDLYRQRQRLSGMVPLDELEETEALKETNPQVLPDEEGTLAAALSRLPANQREVLLLRYYYGYSIAEIASLLSYSEANVTKIITRSKAKLKALLEREGGTP